MRIVQRTVELNADRSARATPSQPKAKSTKKKSAISTLSTASFTPSNGEELLLALPLLLLILLETEGEEGDGD